MILDPMLRNIKTSEEQVEAWIRDQYKHPVESLHTFDEILGCLSQTMLNLLIPFLHVILFPIMKIFLKK